MLNEVKNIGKWELLFEDGKEISGKGFEELLKAAANLKEVIVVYTKHLNWLLHIGGNFLNYGESSYFVSAGEKGTKKFFYLKSGNIEFREWDNFFSKVDDKKHFLTLLDIMRTHFNAGLKNKMGLEKHCKTTFAHDMWEDIAYQSYFKAPWARGYVFEMLPNSMEEYELYEGYNKAGFFFGNQDYKDKVIRNVHQYDITSSYLSSISRRKFPKERFTAAESFDDVDRILQNEDYAWIGAFVFYGLKYKVELPISLTSGKNRWGERCEDGGWYIVLNNVDIQWFKQIFEWENCEVCCFYYAKHDYLPKNYIEPINYLFLQKKGAITENEKLIYKPRTELVYGQSIKAATYYNKVVFSEETKEFEIVGVDEEVTIEGVRQKLSRRYLPFQLGIWTASWSRLEEIQMILAIGKDNVVYGDTDSVKFVGEKGVKIIEERNKEIQKELKKILSKRSVLVDERLGLWKNEGDAKEFKFINPKWYAYRDQEDNLTVKAAGANVERLEKYLKTFKNPVVKFNRYMEVPGLMTKFEESKDVKGSVKITHINKIGKDLIHEGNNLMNGTILY